MAAGAMETPTVEAFSVTYLREHVEVKNKPSTQRAVREVLRNWIIPQFGDRPLHTIENKDLRRWVNVMLRKGLSASSVNQRLKVLAKLLAFYTEWEGPALPKLKLPLERLPEPENKSFTLEQTARILDAAALQPQPWRAFIVLAAHTGLRIGELRALKWENVELDVPQIWVRENLPGHASVAQTTKGRKARRQQLDGDTASLLADLPRLGPFVFALASHPRRPISYKTALTFLKEFFRSVGIERDGGWHDFRHNFGTHLARRGVALSTIQKMLGHAAISTTMRYVSVASEDETRAVGTLSSAFKGSKNGGP